MELLPARITVLEAELARLKEERGAEADELARMLVRIAEAERARGAAEARVTTMSEASRELEAQWRESQRQLDASREQLRRGAEATETAARRAGMAENSAADGAAALERTRAELEADRARVTDLEAKLARIRREHVAELALLRSTQAETEMEAARALEEERSTAARSRQHAAAAEVQLAGARELIARVTVLIEEMERREEMTAALRARALLQTRRLLCGEATPDAAKEPSEHHVSPEPPRPPPGPARKSRKPPPGEPSMEVVTLDEIDLDLSD